MVETRSTHSTSTAASAPIALSVATPAPLVVYVVPSEEKRLLAEAYLQRTGLHAGAYSLQTSDEAGRLPGVEFASGEQWNAMEAALLQQRLEDGQ